MMKKIKDQRARGIFLAVLGAGLWGVCGTCGQYLFQYKEVTSDWLVPVRLTSAGCLILLGLAVRKGRRVFDIWREAGGRSSGAGGQEGTQGVRYLERSRRKERYPDLCSVWYDALSIFLFYDDSAF